MSGGGGIDCGDVDRGGWIERYLADRLDASEREAFERHYFECDRCFEALERARRIREGFEESDDAPPSADSTSRSGSLFPVAGTAPRSRPGVGIGLAAAAMVAVVIAGVMVARHGAAPDPALVALGAVEPGDLPDWEPARLRGPAGVEADSFERGMEAYAAGEWATAAESLRVTAERRPDAAAARLYLGASLLALGRPVDAIPHLQAATAQPLLADQGRWLLAKSHLQQGDAAAALVALGAIPPGSRWSARARGLEAKVQALEAGG